MKDLLKKAQSYLPPDRIAVIEGAYEFAAHAHEGQTRLSGEPFLDHPVQTALFLAEMHLDATTLEAALLHDVMEDCGVTFQQLDSQFGPEVAKLVDGVTKLSRLDNLLSEDAGIPARSQEDGQAASLQKMLVAMARDVRVVLIKLADRLHNMRTLKAHTPARRIAIAQETLDIYAPLAHRLGMWDMKWQLEDLAFHHLQPAQYKKISRLLAIRSIFTASIRRCKRMRLKARISTISMICLRCVS